MKIKEINNTEKTWVNNNYLSHQNFLKLIFFSKKKVPFLGGAVGVPSFPFTKTTGTPSTPWSQGRRQHGLLDSVGTWSRLSRGMIQGTWEASNKHTVTSLERTRTWMVRWSKLQKNTGSKINGNSVGILSPSRWCQDFVVQVFSQKNHLKDLKKNTTDHKILQWKKVSHPNLDLQVSFKMALQTLWMPTKIRIDSGP